jgi:hypothetical protein
VQLLTKEDANDINPDDQPVLSFLGGSTENPVEIEIGSSIGGSSPTGTDDNPTITAYFSRPKLMEALYGYGEFTLRVKGTFKSGRTYVGEATIHITRFAGD